MSRVTEHGEPGSGKYGSQELENGIRSGAPEHFLEAIAQKGAPHVNGLTRACKGEVFSSGKLGGGNGRVAVTEIGENEGCGFYGEGKRAVR